MRDGARFARQSSLSLEFSAEVRRSVMGSLSFVVHEIDDGSVEDLSGFLFDRRLVGAMETVFDLGVLDLGNVSLYLDRFSSAAQTAVELDVGDNPEARNLRNRWNAVRLLCEAAYFDTGCGRPPAELADSGSPEDEQVRTGSSDVVDAGVNEVIAGLVDSIRSVKFPAKRSATGRPLGTMVSDALKVSMFLRTKPTRANPEIDLWAAMDELDDGSHGATAERTVARQLCGSLLAELTRDLLPTWATSLSAECERALAAEDVESAFVLLRTVRSCLKRVNGSRERITISGRGPFYVFNDRTLKDAELLRAGSNIMKAMIEDWIRSGINEFRQGIPTREELETSSNGVINWVSEAMRQNLKHVPGWEVADSELWELGTRMCALAGASETT
jgi:hypothetical protein